jgi:hypothetical protein
MVVEVRNHVNALIKETHMRLLKETLGILGALVIVALIVAFVAPKRTHAVVATLVQILPGTTTHVGQNQSQLVSLFCPTNFSYCLELSGKGGYSFTAYAVPSGYTLIVTDYQFNANIVNASTIGSSVAGSVGGDSFVGPDGVSWQWICHL